METRAKKQEAQCQIWHLHNDGPSKKRILDIQLIQSNVVGNSQRMEKEGLQRCLRQLEHRGVRVQMIVTDRHPAVMKFLKESRPDVVHKFDAWHMAKGVAKKIDQLAKTRTCREVQLHVRSSVMSSWLQNCLGTYKTKVVTTRLHHWSRFTVYSFGFYSFGVAFSYVGMLCRSQLAAMHYNENSERTQATTAAGQLRWHIQYPCYKKGECTVRPLKTSPTYRYVERLMELLFDYVLAQPQQFQEKLKQVHVPDHLCTQFTRPEKWEAVALHTSRL